MSRRDGSDGLDEMLVSRGNPYRDALRPIVEAEYRRLERLRSTEGAQTDSLEATRQAIEEAWNNPPPIDAPDPEENRAIWQRSISADRATTFYGCSGVKFVDNAGRERGSNPNLWWLKGHTQIASGDVTITVESHGDPFFPPEPDFAAYSIDCWFNISVPSDAWYEVSAMVPVDSRDSKSLWRVVYEASSPGVHGAAEWGATFAVSVTQFDAGGKIIRHFPDIVLSAHPHFVSPKKLGSGIAYYADSGPQVDAWSASVGKVYLSASARTTLVYVHCRYRQVIERVGQGAVWYRTCIRNPTVAVTGPT